MRSLTNRRLVALLVAGFMLAGCETAVTVPSHVLAEASPPPAGFPTGTYQKDVVAERLRMTWTLGPDGTFLEIDEKFDGSPQPGPVWYGTYSVDGSTVTIEPRYPGPFPTTFEWRLDADGELYLRFLDGEDFDREWFVPLDDIPWVPVD
jgi:hypothetical protein